jgi:hypothetical protein
MLQPPVLIRQSIGSNLGSVKVGRCVSPSALIATREATASNFLVHHASHFVTRARPMTPYYGSWTRSSSKAS